MQQKKNIFDYVIYVFLGAMVVCMLYPFWYLLVASFSNAAKVNASGGMMLWPQGFTLENYSIALGNESVRTGFINSVIIVVVGTALNLFFTTISAYALSRKWLYGRKQLMIFVSITMFVGGGFLPTYLIVRGLGLYNTWFALWLPGLIATWNMIMMRTYFQQMPEALEESAKIDGANDWQVLWHIILPMSKPMLAVMTLFYAVAIWNSWFSAAIFLEDRALYPLQLVMRDILITQNASSLMSAAEGGSKPEIAKTLKYAVAFIGTAPILVVYPFIQKYFEKGVMLGSLKE